MRKNNLLPGMVIFLLVFGLPLFGCRHANSQVQLKILESQAFSGRQEREPDFVVIADRQAYDDLYRQAHAHQLDPPQPPGIDFENHLLLAAFMGQKTTAGYGITFEPDPARQGDTLVVTVNMQSPRAGAILPQVMTSPYSLASVDRGGYTSIRFVDKKGRILAVRPAP